MVSAGEVWRYLWSRTIRRNSRLSVVDIQLWSSMLRVVSAETYTLKISSGLIPAVSSGFRPWMPSITSTSFLSRRRGRGFRMRAPSSKTVGRQVDLLAAQKSAQVGVEEVEVQGHRGSRSRIHRFRREGCVHGPRNSRQAISSWA